MAWPVLTAVLGQGLHGDLSVTGDLRLMEVGPVAGTKRAHFPPAQIRSPPRLRTFQGQQRLRHCAVFAIKAGPRPRRPGPLQMPVVHIATAKAGPPRVVRTTVSENRGRGRAIRSRSGSKPQQGGVALKRVLTRSKASVAFGRCDEAPHLASKSL